MNTSRTPVSAKSTMCREEGGTGHGFVAARRQHRQWRWRMVPPTQKPKVLMLGAA
jgi:hypothetical protein